MIIFHLIELCIKLLQLKHLTMRHFRSGTGIRVRHILHKFGMMTSLDFEGIPNYYVIFIYLFIFILLMTSSKCETA